MTRLLPLTAALFLVGFACWATTEAVAAVPGERALIAWLDYTSDMPLGNAPAGTTITHNYRCDLDRAGTGYCPWRIRAHIPGRAEPVWRRDGMARMVSGGLTDPDVHGRRRGLAQLSASAPTLRDARRTARTHGRIVLQPFTEYRRDVTAVCARRSAGRFRCHVTVRGDRLSASYNANLHHDGGGDWTVYAGSLHVR